MITNAQIQAMIAVDRAALVELLAAFYALGTQRSSVDYSLWDDGDFRELRRDVERFLAQPQRTIGTVDRWNREIGGIV